MAYLALSLADLMTIPGFPEAYGRANEDDTALKAILYGCGMDVEKEFDWRYCTHRRINGEIVTCDRVEGRERIDREWLESGYSTYDAQIDSHPDLYFRQELRKLQHITCVDVAFEGDNE